jgi:putative ABC transport system ATP-binding protein
VLITHNAAIQAIADRVIVMADGRIARDTRNERPVAPSEVSW